MAFGTLRKTISDYSLAMAISFFGLWASLGAYARLWEHRQPAYSITDARVMSVDPYFYSNELHFSFAGYRIRVSSEDRPIDFPISKWDPTVEEGDSVDLRVRESFPLFWEELDGMSIDDHK